MIDRRHLGADSLIESAAGCRACKLGRRGGSISGRRPDRAVGFGNTDAPVFLVAEFPRDCRDGGGPFGVRRVGLDPDPPPVREAPIRAALRTVGFDARDVYSTVAVKCAPPEDRRRSELAKSVKRTCLVEHLGVELEEVRPSSVWVTGHHGADMVREYFPAANIPDLSPGGFAKVEAPSGWDRDDMLVARSAHPSSIRHGFEDLGGLAAIANIIHVYVDTES